MSEVLGIALPSTALFDYTSVEALAAYIHSTELAAAEVDKRLHPRSSRRSSLGAGEELLHGEGAAMLSLPMLGVHGKLLIRSSC